MSCNCGNISSSGDAAKIHCQAGKPGDSSGYVVVNPRPDAPAAPIFLLPFRCTIALVTSAGIDTGNITFERGSHADMEAGLLDSAPFGSSQVLEKGVLLKLAVPAQTVTAVATFKFVQI